jgi:hypothetical protein
MKSGSRSCGCRLLFALQKTAPPPLTTCGEKNLGQEKTLRDTARHLDSEDAAHAVAFTTKDTLQIG